MLSHLPPYLSIPGLRDRVRGGVRRLRPSAPEGRVHADCRGWHLVTELRREELSGKRVGAVGRGRDGDHLAAVGLRRRDETWHGAWWQTILIEGENFDLGDDD